MAGRRGEGDWFKSKQAAVRRKKDIQVTLMVVGARPRATGLTGNITSLKSERKKISLSEVKGQIGWRLKKSNWKLNNQ